MKILFVVPDYHSTSVEAHELRQRGHQCTIFVPGNYPRQLLNVTGRFTGLAFKSRLWKCRVRDDGTASAFGSRVHRTWNRFLELLMQVTDHWQLRSLIRTHDVAYLYGSIASIGPGVRLSRRTAEYARARRVRLYLKPAGCRFEDLKRTWSAFDSGAVCGHCGFNSQCDDRTNSSLIDLANEFCESSVNWGYLTSPLLRSAPLLAKSIDLDLWRPNLQIPAGRTRTKRDGVMVLHSFASHGRGSSAANIKGSHIVRQAIEELRSEGLAIEYLEVGGLDSTDMRYLQAQADICVDQLIYGWWGSTALECMALGKPVIGYLRREFVESFQTHFPDLGGQIPVINANSENFKQVVAELVLNPEARASAGRASRAFAESFLDPVANAKRLEEFLQVSRTDQP